MIGLEQYLTVAAALSAFGTVGLFQTGRRGVAPAVAVMVACATQAAALTPIPPCEGVRESGMQIAVYEPLGHPQSGIVVESYSDLGYEGDAPVPPALKGFLGTRVFDCGSGRFLAIADSVEEQVQAALPATEFLRSDVQAGRRLRLDSITRAAKALYPGKVRQFRETEESCSCSVLFPELRPKAMTAFRGQK